MPIGVLTLIAFICFGLGGFVNCWGDDWVVLGAPFDWIGEYRFITEIYLKKPPETHNSSNSSLLSESSSSSSLSSSSSSVQDGPPWVHEIALCAPGMSTWGILAGDAVLDIFYVLFVFKVPGGSPLLLQMVASKDCDSGQTPVTGLVGDAIGIVLSWFSYPSVYTLTNNSDIYKQRNITTNSPYVLMGHVEGLPTDGIIDMFSICDNNTLYAAHTDGSVYAISLIDFVAVKSEEYSFPSALELEYGGIAFDCASETLLRSVRNTSDGGGYGVVSKPGKMNGTVLDYNNHTYYSSQHYYHLLSSWNPCTRAICGIPEPPVPPNSDNKGGIIGGVVGGVAGLTIASVVAGVAIYKRKQKIKKRKYESEHAKLSPLYLSDKDMASIGTIVPIEDFPLDVEPSDFLSFGLNEHQAPVGTALTDTITLTNYTKHGIEFKIEAPSSHQYSLMASPCEGVIAAGEEIAITVSMTVLCTTEIDTEIIILAVKEQEFVALKAKFKSLLSTSLDYKELILEKVIGEGAYGIVYFGHWRGQEVAIKTLKNQTGQGSMKEFEAEMRTMEAIRCPQIVNFFGAVKTEGKLAIVTEFLPFGSVVSCMKNHKFSEQLKMKCLLDCARGMTFLHKSNLLHRDLKPDNLLVLSLEISAAVNCKITDFGTCRDFNKDETQNLTSGIGTPSFMSPELLNTGKYNESTDVYSFAVLAYQMISEKSPYSEGFESLWKITEFVTSGKRLPLDGFSEFSTELVTQCWHQDYHMRPSFAVVTSALEKELANFEC
ncbi:tyrosine protein kinase [Pelomyxa schiedti]|nr:tyrosine protein kinase [Pelomyxa schiedti]